MNLLEALVTGQDLSVEGIESATMTGPDGGVVGRFRDFLLHSHFQPILSLAHRRIVGYEGLVRPRGADGRHLAPAALFDAAATTDEIVFLDRLARNLHVRNFLAAGREKPWLFLNVNASVAIHNKDYAPYFNAMLTRHGLAPQRVVIELVENEVPDEGLLADAMRYYQDIGCLVAIDDFGAGHSNFERIWRVKPEIVKLDRALLVQACESRRVRRVLPSLVALLHEGGCLTLMEGIETEAEVMVAMDAGVDFVQGYFFGRPAPGLADGDAFAATLGRLCQDNMAINQHHGERSRQALAPYVEAFQDFAGLSADGPPAWAALARMLALPGVLRCSVLDRNGCQLGENITVPGRGSEGDPRFYPVADAAGAVWARRPYFRRAVAEPGKVQVSRPYLSVADAHMCVTLSVMVRNAEGEEIVVCADIRWEDG